MYFISINKIQHFMMLSLSIYVIIYVHKVIVIALALGAFKKQNTNFVITKCLFSDYYSRILTLEACRWWKFSYLSWCLVCENNHIFILCHSTILFWKYCIRKLSSNKALLCWYSRWNYFLRTLNFHFILPNSCLWPHI